MHPPAHWYLGPDLDLGDHRVDSRNAIPGNAVHQQIIGLCKVLQFADRLAEPRSYGT